MSALLVVHSGDMDPAVRYGINARFDGACGLCGAPVVAGDRIFQLPRKRTGTAGRWVCAPCRWPDPDRVIDIPFVIRKAEQRLRGGPSYTPSMVEVDVIMDAVGAVVVMTEDEEVLLELLSEGQTDRRPPTMGRAKISILLGILRRCSPPRDA